MKSGLLALTLLLVSCGGDAPPGSSMAQRLQPRALVAQGISNSTITTITNVCNALLLKEAALTSSGGTTHTFASTQTDCENKTISDGDVVVTIQRNNQQYLFKRQDGGDYFFPDVETTQSGIFNDICGNLFNLQNPLVVTNGTTGASEATFFSVSYACRGPADGVCLEITKATVQDNRAIPLSSDLIRIRTNPSLGKVGFFTYRNRVARSFCATNESVSFTSTLK